VWLSVSLTLPVIAVVVVVVVVVVEEGSRISAAATVPCRQIAGGPTTQLSNMRPRNTVVYSTNRRNGMDGYLAEREGERERQRQTQNI